MKFLPVTLLIAACSLLHAQTFLLDLRDSERLDTKNRSDRGIFGGGVQAGDQPDAERNFNVPVRVLEIEGFDNTTDQGRLRVEVDLTRWNANNTRVDPQGVKFAFTINVQAESTVVDANGFLNGTYFGRISVDDPIPNSGIGYPRVETGETLTFSVSDVLVLEAPAGKTVRFNSFDTSSILYWIAGAGRTVTQPTPDTLQFTADGSVGPNGFRFEFEVIDNPNDLEVSSQGNVTVVQQQNVVLPGFFSAVSAGGTQVLDFYETHIDFDGRSLLTETTTVGAAGELVLNFNPNQTSGFALLDVIGSNVEGKTVGESVLVERTDNIEIAGVPVDPDRYRTLGSLNLSSGNTVTLNTDTGSVTGDVTAQSSDIIFDNQGRVWRIFCFDGIQLDAGSTITITGDAGCALVSRRDFNISSPLAREGSAGVDATGNGVPGGAGGNGGNLLLAAEGVLEVAATVSVNGGNGGVGGPGIETIPDPDNPDIMDPPIPPGPGGSGGNGGTLLLAASELSISAAVSADGGDGGAAGTGGPPVPILGGQGGNGGIVVLANSMAMQTSLITADAGAPGASIIPGELGLRGTVVTETTPGFLGSKTLYVNEDRLGAYDQIGLSWDTAYYSLQDALTKARGGDSVWIAKGSYYPDESDTGEAAVIADDTAASFRLSEAVSLYGGLLEGETDLAEASAANPTILSGDITQNDTTSVGVTVDHSDHEAPNSKRVIVSESTTAPRLSHLIITAGRAEGSGEDGGGIEIGNHSIILEHCALRGNYAADKGGGIYGSNVNMLQISNCQISGNSAVQGGGFFFLSGLITVTDSTITDNIARSGAAGGRVNSDASNSLIERCSFVGNRAENWAGGLLFTGGSGGQIKNCLFSGNYCHSTGSGRGAGIYLRGDHTIENCTIVNNYARHRGGAIYLESDNPQIIGSIVWNNRDDSNGSLPEQNIHLASGSVSVGQSLIEGGLHSGLVDNGMNIFTDPIFRGPLALSESAPVLGGDYRLYGESPAIDAASSAPQGPGGSDLAQNLRFVGAAVDMGAYEYNGPRIVNAIPDQVLDLPENTTFALTPQDHFDLLDSVSVEVRDVTVLESNIQPASWGFTALGTIGQQTEVLVTVTNPNTDDIIRETFLVQLIDSDDPIGTFRGRYNMASDGSDDASDWSNNGVANIHYHLFALGDPNVAEVDRSLLPTTTRTENGIVFSYRFRLPLEELSIRPITSTDLQTWVSTETLNGTPDGPIGIQSGFDPDGLRRINITYPLGSDKRFFSTETYPTASLPE